MSKEKEYTVRWVAKIKSTSPLQAAVDAKFDINNTDGADIFDVTDNKSRRQYDVDLSEGTVEHVGWYKHPASDVCMTASTLIQCLDDQATDLIASAKERLRNAISLTEGEEDSFDYRAFIDKRIKELEEAISKNPKKVSLSASIDAYLEIQAAENSFREIKRVHHGKSKDNPQSNG